MTRYFDAYDMEAADEQTSGDDGVVCMHCGADGLYWQETWDAGGKPRPRLYENGKPHVCKPSENDFEVEE